MRQQYCSPEDRNNETKVIEALSKARPGVHFSGCDLRCDYDFEAYKDAELLVIGEIKNRNIMWGEYATIHVAADKIAVCLDHAKRLKCDFAFVVACFDGIYCLNVTPELFATSERRQGGRFDRGDAADVEEMVHFPIDKFKKL
jgi:hypothetical protein